MSKEQRARILHQINLAITHADIAYHDIGCMVDADVDALDAAEAIVTRLQWLHNRIKG